MNGHLAPAEDRLVEQLQEMARGPKRNGLYALWLIVRACDDMLPPNPLSQRAQRRRLEDLRRRLSSLSLQPPLRRALSASIHDLDQATAETVEAALAQLVAPVQEALGAAAGQAVVRAAKAAHTPTAYADKMRP